MEQENEKNESRYAAWRNVSSMRQGLREYRDVLLREEHEKNHRNHHRIFSKNLCHLLRKLLGKHPYGSILVYAPHQSEVDIMPLVRELIEVKAVYFPKVINDKEMCAVLCTDIEKDLVETGTFGIREPVIDSKKMSFQEAMSIDVALITGLGFNSGKFRLGYGRGYYDRFLAVHSVGLKIGCFFDFQYISHWKEQNHDISMDMIVTDKRIYD